MKLKFEGHEPASKYLSYFSSAELRAEKDWLSYIKPCVRCFYAERFSIIFIEFGLH